MWQVAVYTQNLLIEGVEKDDIGIISPYRKQTQKIRKTSNNNNYWSIFSHRKDQIALGHLVVKRFKLK